MTEKERDRREKLERIFQWGKDIARKEVEIEELNRRATNLMYDMQQEK